MQLKDFLGKMTPEIYHNLKQSLELGRWPDGSDMSVEQRDVSLQALIAWEHEHLPEEERIGYMPQKCQSATSAPSESFEETSIIRFKQS
ncbi:MAG: YeaC family protein [Endozoicomonas sp.]